MILPEFAFTVTAPALIDPSTRTLPVLAIRVNGISFALDITLAPLEMLIEAAVIMQPLLTALESDPELETTRLER